MAANWSPFTRSAWSAWARTEIPWSRRRPRKPSALGTKSPYTSCRQRTCLKFLTEGTHSKSAYPQHTLGGEEQKDKVRRAKSEVRSLAVLRSSYFALCIFWETVFHAR